MVEKQDAGGGSLSTQGDVVDPYAMESVSCAAHAGDVEAVPLWAPGGEEQAPRAGDRRPSQKSLAEGEAIRVKVVAAPAVIDRAKDALTLEGAQVPVAVVEVNGQLTLVEGIGRHQDEGESGLWVKDVFVVDHKIKKKRSGLSGEDGAGESMHRS
jgi:hypothetical protein